MIKNDIVKNALRTIKTNHLETNVRRTQKLEQLKQDAKFDKVYKTYKELIFNIAKAKHLGQDIKKLETEFEKAKKELNTLLKKAGQDATLLAINYSCNICNDAGFVNSKKCSCLNIILSNDLLKACGLAHIKLPTFKESKFDIFDDIIKEQSEKVEVELANSDNSCIGISGSEACVGCVDPGTPTNTRAQMEDMYKKLERYTGDLESAKAAVVSMLGNTGVGKTHLCYCATSNAIANGYYTVFTTAFELNANFLKYHLAKIHEKEAILNSYLHCDLLIIDDLGTEPKYNNVTEEYLYLVLSHRISQGLKTIINSNLNLEQIRNNYGERIFSRLSRKDTSAILEIQGKDLRTKR